jgi:hypothetical protein
MVADGAAIKGLGNKARSDSMEEALRMQDEVMQLFRPSLSRLGHTCRQAKIFFAALLIPVLFASSATGQNYLTSTGIPSFAAAQPVGLGIVDASSGNLHLSIPLGSYPQRGTSQPEPITLEYDSNIWEVLSNGATAQWWPKTTGLRGGICHLSTLPTNI